MRRENNKIVDEGIKKIEEGKNVVVIYQAVLKIS